MPPNGPQDMEGALTDSDGAFPNSEGTLRNSEETLADSEGTFPASEGTFPASEGTFPASEGTFPDSEGELPTSEGGPFPASSSDGISLHASLVSAMDGRPVVASEGAAGAFPVIRRKEKREEKVR
jgi:hypothetical protein